MLVLLRKLVIYGFDCIIMVFLINFKEREWYLDLNFFVKLFIKLIMEVVVFLVMGLVVEMMFYFKYVY